MKKIMIVAVAIAMAAMAQAAQVTWSATAIAGTGSTSYYAAFVDVTGMSDVTADSVALALMAGTFEGSLIYDGAATYNASKDQVAVAFAKKTAYGDYANEQTVSYMTIVFDAANAADAQNYLVTSGETPVTGQFSAAGLLAVAQGSQAGKTWTAVAVPEPTSGLLMLVGLAGLALRRRRA